MSILEELYNGNVDPSNRYIRDGGEYQKANDALCEYLDELLTLLGDDQKSIYNKIEDSVLQLLSISEKDAFVDGFRLGAQIMWEVTNYQSENFLR